MYSQAHRKAGSDLNLPDDMSKPVFLYVKASIDDLKLYKVRKILLAARDKVVLLALSTHLDDTVNIPQPQ